MATSSAAWERPGGPRIRCPSLGHWNLSALQPGNPRQALRPPCGHGGWLVTFFLMDLILRVPLVPLFTPHLEEPLLTAWLLYQGSRGLPGLNFSFLVFFSIFSLPRQVLFHDVTFTMGQVVSRESQGRQETLFRCVRSMPSDPDRAYNSCYSAGENSGVRRGLL